MFPKASPTKRVTSGPGIDAACLAVAGQPFVGTGKCYTNDQGRARVRRQKNNTSTLRDVSGKLMLLPSVLHTWTRVVGRSKEV